MTQTSTQRRTHVGDSRTFEEAAKEAERALFDHTLLSAHEEKLLARQIERGDFTAKQQLIEHNVRLVKKVAIIYSRNCRFLTTEDLFAAGIEGLTRATEKFDYRKGFRFTTYAHNWIEQAIGREIAKRELTIRPPVHIHGIQNKLARFYYKFEAENHRPPTDEELSELTDVCLRDIADWHVARTVTSLNVARGDDPDSGEFGDILPDPNADTAREATTETERERAAGAIAQLSPLEQQVIELRFRDEYDLKGTAKQLDLSTFEVRKIEHAAMKKLETHLQGDQAA